MTNEENISIIELAQRFPNLTVSITYGELVEAFRQILQEEKLKNDILLQEETSDILLTEEQVIEILDTSHSTLWRWNRDCYLCCVKIGCKNRYKKSDVDHILKNRSSKHEQS